MNDPVTQVLFAVTEKLGELSILKLYFTSKTLDSNGNFLALADIGSAIGSAVNPRYILCRLLHILPG